MVYQAPSKTEFSPMQVRLEDNPFCCIEAPKEQQNKTNRIEGKLRRYRRAENAPYFNQILMVVTLT